MVDQQNSELFNDLVAKLDDLMPLPMTIKKLVELTRDPDTPLHEIVAALEKDQAMVSKILKLANSSYYGFVKQINTISHAVVCLGYNSIKNLALTATTHSIFNKGVISYALEQGALFKHSYSVALGARTLAKQLKYPNQEEIYVMGLLHDVGKVVLDQYAKQQFIDVIRLFRKGNISFLQAEEEVLGFNHGEIGAKIAEKWNLTDELIETIRYHHAPQLAPASNLSVHVVHVADIVSELLGIGLGYDGLNYELQPESLEKLKLAPADVETLMISVMDDFKSESLLEE
jgi:putative nucleotidyltransferase with HDIG domain